LKITDLNYLLLCIPSGYVISEAGWDFYGHPDIFLATDNFVSPHHSGKCGNEFPVTKKIKCYITKSQEEYERGYFLSEEDNSCLSKLVENSYIKNKFPTNRKLLSQI
jgi:hypothetical protein